ncbi:MAG: hypothetical protein FJ398_06975 [Verrucomicrobia bacterium]|nr:hypothetical protein [Verrucomicrobiota bacterium]
MRADLFFVPLFLGLVFTLGIESAEPKGGDRKFEAQLIWGTDKEKPDDPKLKKVDPELVAGLQKIFRWAHYYQVTNVTFVVPLKPKPGTRVKLSDKCDIEVSDKGKPMTEVKLFGEEKLVRTINQAIPQCLVIGGDVPNQTAWFVVLTPK